VAGSLYDLSADRDRGDLVLRISEITPRQVAEVLDACGLPHDEVLSDAASAGEAGAESGATSAPAGALREIELGTEADAPFVAQLGGVANANARILSVVNAVNGIYEADLGLTNRVVVQRAWSGSDPYTTNDSGQLLSQFRSEFSQGIGTHYDDAMLISGRDFEGTVIGRAYLPGVCGSYRYGVNQYYQRSDSFLKVIIAHEEGHNLGANHATSGIMSSTINSSINSFSSTSQQEIANRVAAVSCLDPVASGGPPELEPVGPQAVVEGEVLSIQLSGSDPDGESLTFGATPLPQGASITAGGAFRYQPPFDTVGCGGTRDQQIQFFVTDESGNSASEMVPISVADRGNGATPVLSDPANRTIDAGTAVQIQLQASDADGDSISYSASGMPGGATLSQAGLFRWTPGVGDAGSHVILFQATDCTGRSATQSTTIQVQVVAAPHLNALSPSSGPSRTVVTISGSGFAGSSVSVSFGGKNASLRSVSSTAIVVSAPKARRGVTSVPVTVTRDGTLSDNALTFTYTGGGSKGGGGGRGRKVRSR
jgi:hypothetical protein